MRKFLFLFYALLSLKSLAQVPAGYYDGTENVSGEELKTKLYNIIKGHKEYPYTSSTTDVWDILKETDRDPNNSENVIGLYSGFSMNAAKEYDNGNGWTREHVWAKSRGNFGTDPGPGTDVHHLRAEDNTTNTARSNRSFAECDVPYVDNGGTYQGATESFTSNTEFVWEPRSAVKGDVARMIFYMATRYEGENSEPDLELVDYILTSGSTAPEHGKLTDLLFWHIQDPVDDYERQRNDIIYGYQGNRNPFIDHPEFVSKIWGNVSGSFASIDKTDFNVDFGAVMYGNSTVQSYKLKAFNLEADITVTVESPFFLSQDNSNFTNSLTLVHETGNTNETFSVYVKFEPQAADDLYHKKTISHTSVNMTQIDLEVAGKEGEQNIVSISQARSKADGTVVMVSGVVIGGENNSSRSRVIYDGTAGIVIRSPDGETNETGPLTVGDSVVVSGALVPYNELLQINGSPMSVVKIKSRASLPNPTELTIDEVGEIYESQLVIIKNISFEDVGSKFTGGGSESNFNITDGTGTLVLRIGNSSHPLVGTTIPSGKFDLIGYIGQFGADYQISPRYLSDLQPGLISIEEAKSKPDGTQVKVSGIVIGGTGNSTTNRIIFDGTAGLALRSLDEGNLSSALEIGDNVMIIGGTNNYNGLFEIEKSPVSITVIEKEVELPLFQEILLDELGEEYESELITIKNLEFTQNGKFSTGNYNLSDGNNTIVLRIGLAENPLVGLEIPQGKVSVSGYVGQSGENYQLYLDAAENLVMIESEVLGYKITNSLVYPNPVNQMMNLNVDGSNDLEVVLYDYSGKVNFRSVTSDRKVDVSKVKAGLYILVVRESDQIYYSRVIKN